MAQHLNTSTPEHLEPEGRGTPKHLNTSTPRAPWPRKKLILTSLILLSSLLALTYLSFQLIARLHYHFGGDAMEAKDYAEAVRHYEKAAQGQPEDARMHKALGEALHALSIEKPVQDAFPLEKRARKTFDKAAHLIPIDAEAHYGLARSSARLEQMHYLLQPNARENPYRPLPHFHRAIELRPNGILYRYALARYLYRIGDIRALHQAVQDLARTYPPTYNHLKKEPFWSAPFEHTVQQGLLQAVEAGTMLREAHTALADLLERNNQPQDAIRHYLLALQQSPRENQPSHHIRLGRFYLQAARQDRAEQAFMQALKKTTHRAKDLERIFSAYQAHDQAGSFIAFFERADHEVPFPLEARLVVARALIETQAYYEARHLLERLNRRRPTAEAHYLLYTIAREQKDLDRMELAIQKATVLDPRNSRYHSLFSRVLRRAGKLEDAEKAATRALEQSDEPKAALLHYRARLRRRLNDPEGALSDWQAALALAPEEAAYHAQAAEVLIQLARFDRALEHAARAASLEPDKYRERYSTLQEQLKEP